jgi:hypothetical protein
MRLSLASIVAVAAWGAFLSTDPACAATIDYHVVLYNNSGVPIQGGRVIAGTFKPGFNVSNYACTYSDPFCNPYENNYSLAVADGNFIPFDAGGLTSSTGIFSGSGISTATGSQIWTFAFSGSQPNGAGGQVLATGSGPSFFVPAAGSTGFNSSGINQFIFGQSFNSGLKLTGLPVPEPASATVFAVGATSLIIFRMRRASLRRA